jgi:homoserine kinase
MASLRALGIAAVISGAGPTVLALCESDEQVETVRRTAPEDWRLEVPPIDLIGAAVITATE